MTRNPKELPIGYQVIGRKMFCHYYIYKLVNLDNGKVYIGSTSRPQRRAVSHFYGIKYHRHPNRLVNADSYCEFAIEIVDEAPSPRKMAKMEAEYIKLYRSYDERYGYNALDHKAQNFRKEAGLPYRKYPIRKPKKEEQ